MSFEGTVLDGQIVFAEPLELPNGTRVEVTPIEGAVPQARPGVCDWDAALKAARGLDDGEFDFESYLRQFRSHSPTQFSQQLASRTASRSGLEIRIFPRCNPCCRL